MNLIKIGNNIRCFTDDVGSYKLEPGKVYSLAFDMGGAKLVFADSFNEPEDFFYEDEGFHRFILKSFNELKANLGVCLQGVKGQGKSVSAKKLAMVSGLPIITITGPVSTDNDFITFLNSIPQDYVLLIDEFEKIFKTKESEESDNHSQNAFLSFLDGASFSANKKLFIITCNEGINEYLLNRPGRIRYLKRYDYISNGFFNYLIDKLLVYPEYKADLVENLHIRDTTVDLLKSIIKDINIHNVPYSTFKSFFNYRESILHYQRYVQNEAGIFEFDQLIETNKEINRQNLGGYYEAVVLSSTENEIVIRCQVYCDETEKYVKKVYKIMKMPFSSVLPSAAM